MESKDIGRFPLTAIGGAVPVAGGFMSAISQEWIRREQEGWREVVEEWIKLREEETKEILATLHEILEWLDTTDEKVKERMTSASYHSILRRCFRNWAGAESEEKRTILRNILTNAAGSTLASDDLVKLFTDWVGKYSEVHFKVIKTVYEHQRISRGEIWDQIHGGRVRDDSAEADLFKWVVHELSVGHIIRQERETDGGGRFLKQREKSQTRRTMMSAFDYKKCYVLTKMGEQFVHYGMTEVVKKMEHEK